MSQVGVAQSGNSLCTVTVTQDDALHKWTAIHVVNDDVVPYTISGTVNSIPFSINVLAGTTMDHALNLSLIQITNWKGDLVWVPSLNGTTPMAYSIGMSQP